MAAVLSPKSLSFPHNILHDNLDIPAHTRMQRNSPPKPLLPPITSLISDIDKQAELAPQRSPGLDQQRRISGGSYGPHPPTPDCISFSGSPRSGMPPTPPLPGTSSFDFAPRPGTSTAGSPTIQNSSQNGYFARSPTRNPEAYAQRSLYPPVPDTSSWNSSGSPTSSRSASDESQLAHNGTTKTDSSYPDPTESTSPYTGLAQQRPLPANFPPALPSPSQQLPPIDPQMAGTQYQHHHHYPATGATSYQQSNERYQCPTCQKAFSRPSSLKIHTYSHTGEKPFKCKYEGCGKYFSVRSNMKRHEKGCHGAETSSVGGNSPKAS